MPRLTQQATMSAADTFTSTQMATALEGQTRNAYSVIEINAECLNNSGNMLAAAAVTQQLELAITRRDKTAMPNVGDIDVVKKFGVASVVMSAVGQMEQPNDGSSIFTFRPPDDARPIIVEDPLYILLDSALTGQTADFMVTIEYEIVQISEIDRLNLIAQSLLAA